MSQSPETAGGEGFTFAGDAAAFYLAALLAEAHAPGISDRVVVQVSVEQRDLGEPLDDLVVDFENAQRDQARLSLQAKRSLTISNAPSNKDFREIIRDCWGTLHKNNFRKNIDRYGAVVGTIAPVKERNLIRLSEWARESSTPEIFENRFAKSGSASVALRALKNNLVTLIDEVKGSPCTREEIHQFFSHFVLIKFDFLSEGATVPSQAINHIRNSLTPEEASKAPLVWSRLVQLARSASGKAGQYDRARLLRAIGSIARLRGADSLISDLHKLTELANSYLKRIPDDVSGTKLERVSLIQKLDAKLESARLVQIRGLPGTGKSVVMKQIVQRGLSAGPVLFLKAEQLTGSSWINYAATHGLSNVSLEKLLVEVGAVGTPILFIDAIDRIEKEQQSIVVDLLSAIVDSPLLNNWRIVVSLRDTGIEILRNWLGEYISKLRVEMLEVSLLSDDEASVLASEKPHLKPLLFGSDQIKRIVRRPFFAKVLSENYEADPGAQEFIPKSEVDLIVNWWRRGGYNEAGQDAIERQQTLLELARCRSRLFSQPVKISQLSSIKHVNALISDGILQNELDGVAVSFSHDIFFEWAYFFVLREQTEDWVDQLKESGEPPAVARVVELLSQWIFATEQEDWSVYLQKAQKSTIRSQWVRAWLVGPLGSTKFEGLEDQFAKAIFADDFQLFRKALVWYQAEKTTPNASLLVSEIPEDQRQRFADMLGWPSDVLAWRRLIGFILKRIPDIPRRLYPEITALFEVWQNAFSGIPNPISHAILQVCAGWLESLDAISVLDAPDDNYDQWKEVPEQGALKKQLRQLILRSSTAEPTFAKEYLQRFADSERNIDGELSEVFTFSPTLVNALSKELVDLTLASHKQELPDEQVSREEKESAAAAKRLKAIRAKPAGERTRNEELALSGMFHYESIGDFSHFDWEKLSLLDDHRSFTPPSPLREPFHSLFNSSPDEALRLLRELCNHAMEAWRQLHRYSRERERTPIPLELKFSWGSQQFWGGDREYLWFRSSFAPDVIGSGLMALEDWAFSELDSGRPIDEIIHQIVEGNSCIAVLGVAAMLSITVDEVTVNTAVLVTSQRLLAADNDRMKNDFQSEANLIGFMNPLIDRPHVEAIKAANGRPIRRKQLAWILPRFVFTQGSIGEKTREALLNFENNLPYQYEEHQNVPEIRDYLSKQAAELAEMAVLENYQAYRVEENPDQIVVEHVSPSANKPENIAKVEKASRRMEELRLWSWASKSFESGGISDGFTISNAIATAQQLDTKELFTSVADDNEEELTAMNRGAVAATAALTLNFRDDCSEDDLAWARDVVIRALNLPESLGPTWIPSSRIPWHHAIYAAKGLAADIRFGTAGVQDALQLLNLVCHPLEDVSLIAVEEACKLWANDKKLSWAALSLAFSLCTYRSRREGPSMPYGGGMHSQDEAENILSSVLDAYENERDWTPLPLPPPPWVRVEEGGNGRKRKRGKASEDSELWAEPDVSWNSKYAAEILKRIPLEKVLDSGAKDLLLEFFEGALAWTNNKNSPPWKEDGRRDRSATYILEWTRIFGASLGHLAGLIPLEDLRKGFLDPILNLEDEHCWALLSPFTDSYICRYLYDASVVPDDATAILDLCLDRFLQAPTFKRDSYRSGEIFGFDMPELAKTLMFVSVERADLAARYVNGDWTEIDRILPLIDKFIHTAGWAFDVMGSYLTLCERSKDFYPAEVFADQVLSVLNDAPDNLHGWQGTFTTARIAELVQYIAYRDTPLPLELAQKFLRILDTLVDMGDRRSAALQLGEIFREVRLSS